MFFMEHFLESVILILIYDRSAHIDCGQIRRDRNLAAPLLLGGLPLKS
jgi:hypothetical protein